MSAKCKYSPKFWPLVKQAQSQGSEVFKQFMLDNFIDGQAVYDNIIRGANYSPANNIINEVKPVDKTKTKVVEEDSKGSVETMYIGNPSGYRNMVRNFKKEIISRAVFNKDLKNADGKFGVFIDAEQVVDGRSILNSGILNYKLSLINKLRDGLGLNKVENVSEDSEFVNIYNETIEAYSISRNGSTEENSDLKDAYVTLKRFDSLLKSFAPFVEIKPEYKKSNVDSIDKYVYKGPNVQHFTGFSSSEWADALEQSSNLAKMILDYLPETNEDGVPTEAVIGIEGFTSVMGSLQTELRNPQLESMKSHKNDVYKGANIPMVSILSDYITGLEQHSAGAAAIEGSHLTYMLGKLRGIRDYIYNSGMNKDVQNMFTAMFFKNIPIKYRSYQVDQGRLKGRNLSEQYVNNQLMRIYDTVQSAAYILENDVNKFERICETYNISITPNKITLFTSTNDGVKSEVELRYSVKNGVYYFDSMGFINEQTARDFIYDVTGMIVPDEFMDLLHSIQPNDKRTLFEIFKETVAIPLIHASHKHNKTPSQLTTTKAGLITNLYNYKTSLVPIANIQSIIYGSETASVIKNPAGNNIPKYQLISLAQNYHAMLHEYENNPGIFETNLLFRNRENNLVESPLVRSDVAMRGKIKTPSQLTTNEVLQLAIFEDFYASVDTGTIYLQNTTFADKNTHYLIPYNIKNTLDDGTNLQDIIRESLKTGNSSELFKLIYETRSAKMQLVTNNLLDDYSEVLGKNFNLLEEVDQYLVENKIELSKLKEMFGDKTFYEEIHGYTYRKDKNKIARVNETILNWNRTFNNEELTKARLEKEKRFFIKNLIDNGFKLNKYDSSKAWNLSKQYPGWQNKITGNLGFVKVKNAAGKYIVINSTNAEELLNPNNTIELHPVLETFFMTDVLLSNEYTSLMTGEVWAHPNKNTKGELDSDDYYEFSEANRLIAQNKRAVIYGATVHPFLQGLKYGVADNINIAVVSDIPGTVWNMLGEEKTNLDTMDGSGFSSPYQSRFENNSLVDAAVGHDKKTIMHDNDPRYGRPTLLKWAVFELTNDRRRKSGGSKLSMDNLFKKMHNIPIEKHINLNKYYQTWVTNHNGTLLKVKNPNTGEVYTIRGFEYNGEMWIQNAYNENGDFVGGPLYIHTIADLDEAFGGAYGMIENNGNLEYCDANIDIVSTIIGDYNLKDKMISYVVNKSAIKVGAGNVNSNQSFYDETELKTINMSTKFGGVQMNADHDLDLSHVTEMTQMLSALIQNGYTSQFVNKIYSDIGSVVAEALSDFDSNIKSDDPDFEKLYTLLGKALIDSFMDKDKDTLGLAQAFVAKAEKSLSESTLSYKLPFSAATVSGAFIATVTSMLNKKGIRRKYDGLAGVLCPSHDAIQYYKIGNHTMTFDELYKVTNPARTGYWVNATNSDFINERVMFNLYDFDSIDNYQLNPFIKPINQNDIDFEDTILYGDPGSDPLTWEEVYIDSFTKYDEIKHLISGKEFYKWEIKPKNLKQSNLKFELVHEGQVIGKFSEYQLDSVRASQYWAKYQKLRKDGKEIPVGMMLLLGSRKYNTIVDGIETLTEAKNIPITQWDKMAEEWMNIENKRTQKTLRAIDLGKTFEFRGLQVTAQNVELEPAEIIMGRRNVQALGLREGDSIYDIQQRGWEFFYDRLSENYPGVTINPEYYDAVMYDGSGNKILVMVASEEDAENRLFNSGAVHDESFVIVDGEVYVDEQKLTSTDEKQFYSIIDDNGERQRLIVVNNIERFNELKNSNRFPLIRYNYSRDLRQSILLSRYSEFATGEPVTIAGIPVEITDDFDSIFTVEQLLEIEEQNFNKKLENLAVERYNAFNESLNFVCARIPTQGMQSFMPMRVVAFTDSKINDVYVTKSNTWLEGSDFL